MENNNDRTAFETVLIITVLIICVRWISVVVGADFGQYAYSIYAGEYDFWPEVNIWAEAVIGILLVTGLIFYRIPKKAFLACLLIGWVALTLHMRVGSNVWWADIVAPLNLHLGINAVSGNSGFAFRLGVAPAVAVFVILRTWRITFSQPSLKSGA